MITFVPVRADGTVSSQLGDVHNEMLTLVRFRGS